MRSIEVYDGTRNICDRMATKILNACDEFWLKGATNVCLGIIGENAAEAMETKALKMQAIANNGFATGNDWDIINLAIKLHNEQITIRDSK